MKPLTLVRLPAFPEVEMPTDFQKHKILLVEDYEPNILTMMMYFEILGYECDSVKKGKEALEKFSTSHYNLVIMDLQLPDIDGLETTKRMRLLEKEKNLAPTPIIASSGHSSDDDRIFCLRAGMNDCLSKPYHLEDLKKKLLQWMGPPSR